MDTCMKQLLKQALTAENGGQYDPKTAANIISGGNRMDSNIRALRMEENYFISPKIWTTLFKKKEN